MTQPSTKRAWPLLISAILLLANACGDITTPVDRTRPSLSAATASAATLRADSLRAVAALKRLAWMGQIHNDGLKELRRTFGPLAAKHGKSQQGYCLAMIDIGKGFTSQFAQGTGRTRTPEEIQQLASLALQASPGCSAFQRPMSIFSTGVFVPALRAPMALVDSLEDATGDFDPFLDDLDARVAAAGGSVPGVTDAVMSVLMDASNLGDPDYNLLAGVGAVAIASAEEWVAIASGGELDECTHPDCTEWEMSILRRHLAWPIFVKRGIAIDVVGIIGGVRMAWVGNIRRWIDLFEAGGWGGLVASGGYLAGLIT